MLGASFANMFTLNVILRGITAQTFLQTRTFTFKMFKLQTRIYAKLFLNRILGFIDFALLEFRITL